VTPAARIRWVWMKKAAMPAGAGFDPNPLRYNRNPLALAAHPLQLDNVKA